jgi:hypothetical protein
MNGGAIMEKDHQDGFEKERKFKQILYRAICDCPLLKSRTVQRIIACVAPEFAEGLFERPCVRKLRYIGYGSDEFDCPSEDEFFQIGKVCESIEFNGATYTIQGYRDGESRIGCAYFEWID